MTSQALPPAFQAAFDLEQDPRKAGLFVHGLLPEDQHWILSRLPDGQRQALEALLSELKELGIPAERDLFSDMLAVPASLPYQNLKAPSEPPVPGATPAFAAQLEVLDRAEPAELAHLLRDEPAGLVACFLEIHPWRWKEAFEGNACGFQRHELAFWRMEHPDRTVGPALRTALVLRVFLCLTRRQVMGAGMTPVSDPVEPVRRRRWGPIQSILRRSFFAARRL